MTRSSPTRVHRRLQTHQCDDHIIGMVGLNPDPTGRPQVMGKTTLCCRCGRVSVEYMGVVEAGHGPFVRYQMPQSPIVVAHDLPKIATVRSGPPGG